MPDVSYVESSLKNYLDETEISIQVSLDGFSFCIYTPRNFSVKAFRYYKFTNVLMQEDLLNNTSDVLHKDDLLRLHQNKTRVIYVNRNSTILPDEYVDPAILKQILEFNQPIGELDEIHHQQLPFEKTQLVHTLPTYFAGMMQDRFEEVKFYNQACSLIRLAHSLKDSLTGDVIFLNLNREFFDVVALTDGELKLYNTFLYVNSTDLLYFVLFVCKQLNFDIAKTIFYLSGEQSTDKALTGELGNYLKQMELQSKVPQLDFGSLFSKLNKSQFITLLNLPHCE